MKIIQIIAVGGNVAALTDEGRILIQYLANSQMHWMDITPGKDAADD